jgi:hypothetical protein
MEKMTPEAHVLWGQVGLAADFGKLITADTENWGEVIRATNIKAE